MSSDPTISRRRFLESLAAVGVVVACGPTAAPAPSASSSASAPVATAKPVSIEWWRRNYTPGSQNAETITSDAAVKGWKERNPNFTITIQGGPFGPETDQKFDIAILQQKAGPDVFHTTGGDVLKYAAAGQLSEPPLTDAERRDFNPSALQATTYKGKVVANAVAWVTRDVREEMKRSGFPFAFRLAAVGFPRRPVSLLQLNLGRRARRHHSLIRLDEQTLKRYYELGS